MMSEEITGCKTGGRNHRKQTTLNEDPCPGSNRERACRRASRSIHRLRPARTGGRGQRRFSQIGGRVAPHGRHGLMGPWASRSFTSSKRPTEPLVTLSNRLELLWDSSPCASSPCASSLWANSCFVVVGAGTAVGLPQRGHSQIVPILRREILSNCRHCGQAK